MSDRNNGIDGGNTMVKVYDMTTGNPCPDTTEEGYTDEVLYSQYQPELKDLAELRLHIVPVEVAHKSPELPEDLCDVDCESFISSQAPK